MTMAASSYRFVAESRNGHKYEISPYECEKIKIAIDIKCQYMLLYVINRIFASVQAGF
jgi:hypothetical protein